MFLYRLDFEAMVAETRPATTGEIKRRDNGDLAAEKDPLSSNAPEPAVCTKAPSEMQLRMREKLLKAAAFMGRGLVERETEARSTPD